MKKCDLCDNYVDENQTRCTKCSKSTNQNKILIAIQNYLFYLRKYYKGNNYSNDFLKNIITFLLFVFFYSLASSIEFLKLNIKFSSSILLFFKIFFLNLFLLIGLILLTFLINKFIVRKQKSILTIFSVFVARLIIPLILSFVLFLFMIVVSANTFILLLLSSVNIMLISTVVSVITSDNTSNFNVILILNFLILIIFSLYYYSFIKVGSINLFKIFTKMI